MAELSLREKVEGAAKFLQQASKNFQAEIGIILGTGLGKLADEIEGKIKVAYEDIPYFAQSTAPGHLGQIVFGFIGKKKVMAMQGRLHYYDGYSSEQITFPVRVMKALKAKILIESNAAGGMNPQFQPGDLMIITDHINFTGLNPLLGPNDDALGSRFPDMCNAYDKKLIDLAEGIAREEKIKFYKGVYVGVTGPNLETAAEYRFFRTIGGDAVGMSTVAEVIVAAHCGLRVLGISCITDRCLADALMPANILEILKVAEKAEPVLTRWVKKIVEKI